MLIEMGHQNRLPKNSAKGVDELNRNSERIPRSLSKRKQRSRLYGAAGLASEYKKASFLAVESACGGLHLAAGSFNTPHQLPKGRKDSESNREEH